MKVPGTGLEPVRPRGAARFKLAVSAFHHPGLARGSALAHDPIRGARCDLPNSGSMLSYLSIS